MSVTKIWNYLIGYVIIKIEGKTLESFINVAVSGDVFLWDIVKIDRNALTAKVGIRRYAALKQIARQAGCRFYIISKVGLPFALRKLKYRKPLLGGAILFLFLLYAASSIIWNVKISGTETIPAAEIRKILSDSGLRQGVFKFQVDKSALETELLLKDDRLSWVDISFKGVNAVIKIVERQPPPELAENMPCSVVAAKAGLVEDITVLNGDPVVKPGDTVVSGQVLISGIMKSGDETPPYTVHASGIVKARVWYHDSEKVSLVQHLRQRTGKTAAVYRLRIGGREIAFQKKPPFECYDMMTKIAGLQQFGVELDIYHQVDEKKRRLSVEEAESAAKDILKARVMEKLPPPAELKSMVFARSLDAKGNAAVITMVAEVVENIGVKQRLGHEELILLKAEN